MRIVSFVKGAG